MEAPLILDYEIYDEEGPCAPYFTGRITDAEGRIICNSENEERAAELVDYVSALRARVARLEEALKEISSLYWIDAPAPEEMREIARCALEEK